jgi:hypothetical protein
VPAADALVGPELGSTEVQSSFLSPKMNSRWYSGHSMTLYASPYNCLFPALAREYERLANIAPRLEWEVCSEAASERAFGAQKRILAPYCPGTKMDLLLALSELQSH